MRSVWLDTAKMPSFDPLRGNIKTEVLVVGGGAAGILCADALKKRGIDTVLVEAGRLCRGITGNTTAKITAQHGFIYQKLLKSLGRDKARMYYDANAEAVGEYRRMCRGVDCDFENKDSYIYSSVSPGKAAAELEALGKIGVEADFAERIPLSVNSFGAVRIKNQAQFNPIKFFASFVGDLKIYENTMIRRIDGNTAVADNGTVTAGAIVIASHFPFINRHGSYFLKMYQHRSYCAAVESDMPLDGMYADESDTGMSFRTYKNMLIIGGGGHRTGKDGGGYRELENFIKRRIGSAKIRYKWAAQDCMTLDGMPYIGRYSALTENLYTATGFNKWGMTSALAAARILADMISGGHSKYEKLFSPSRSILKPQLAVNAFESAAGLLYPTVKRCPHLGCALKWNRQEHTWDCPCHGSRFTDGEKLIDNPSLKNLKRP